MMTDISYTSNHAVPVLNTSLGPDTNGTPVFDVCRVSNVNSTNDVQPDTLDEVIVFVNLYIPPILIIFGNVFNVLAIMVMRHKYFRNLSTSVYMMAGAVNDASSLLISLIAHWVSVNFPEAIARNKAMDVMCKFFNFYGWGNCDFSIMVTAAMTADRAYAIKYPLKNSSANSIKRAKIVIAVLAVVVVLKEFHFWFTSVIVPADRKDRMCDVDLSSLSYCHFYHRVWPWIHIAFLSLCFLVIIFSNCIIIKSVKNAGGKSFRKTMKNNNSEVSARRNTKSRLKWRQITAMLLADSFALLLLTFPFSVHLAVTLTMKDEGPEVQKINGYVFSMVLYLLYSNKCVNFCLYCMTGSRFRMALREVITCKRLRCQGGKLFTVLTKSQYQGSTFTGNNTSTPNSSSPGSSLKREHGECEETDKF
ncbi:neuropeptides capa receptor-like [Haliotis cracherodii]|uniref:neuropeptides capa receptor-like n=1 Tax=Haliotis cracherodii TaxID=6455 RepID=UPI0039EA6D87